VAQQHFAEARDHQAHKDWVACENSIDEAIRIQETPGLRFHLAFCKEQQHRWVEALVDYRRAGELLSHGTKADDVAELLPPAIQNLETSTPQLRLLLDPVPKGTQLFVDDVPVSPNLLGVGFPVDPGARTVKVTAPGKQPFVQDVNLVPQERRTLRVQLVSRAASDASLDGSRQTDSGAAKPAVSAFALTLAGEALLALGGLGLGVGYTASGAEDERQADQVRAALGSQKVCKTSSTDPRCGRLEELVTSQDNARKIATLSYAAAGAATAAFLVTWFVWPSDESDDEGLDATFDQRGAYLGWHGRF
jgi:hypothetical protein